MSIYLFDSNQSQALSVIKLMGNDQPKGNVHPHMKDAFCLVEDSSDDEVVFLSFYDYRSNENIYFDDLKPYILSRNMKDYLDEDFKFFKKQTAFVLSVFCVFLYDLSLGFHI